MILKHEEGLNSHILNDWNRFCVFILLIVYDEIFLRISQPDPLKTVWKYHSNPCEHGGYSISVLENTVNKVETFQLTNISTLYKLFWTAFFLERRKWRSGKFVKKSWNCCVSDYLDMSSMSALLINCERDTHWDS